MTNAGGGFELAPFERIRAFVRSVLETDKRILALGFARMVDSIGNSFLIIVLPIFLTSGRVSGEFLDLSPVVITGIVLSAFGFFNSGLQPFVGNFSDRIGKRRLFVVVGLLILTLSNFVYSLVDSYIAVLLVRIAQGLGVALTVPTTVALVNELAKKAARGEAMGIFNTFRMVGFGLGPVIAGRVVTGGPYTVLTFDISGFDAAFYIAAFGALVGAILVWLLVTDPDADELEDNDGDGNGGIAVFDEKGDHLLDPVFTLGVSSVFMAIGISLLEPLEHQINMALEQSAFMFGLEFSAFTLAQIIFQTPIGRWSDMYGRKPFILGGLLILTPATMIQGFVGTPVGMIVARFFQGIAGAAVLAPSMALAGDIAGAGRSGTTLSVLTMSFGLGVAFGPLLGGTLSGVAVPFGHPYALPFVFGGILGIVGFLMVVTQVEETVTQRSAVD